MKFLKNLALAGLLRYKHVYLAIIIFIVTLTTPYLFAQNNQQKIGGELSSKVSWHIENNTLFISGTDTIPSTHLGQRSPWYDYSKDFQSVVIGEGITYVGQNLFVKYKDINSLTIAGSVNFLAPNAFNNCSSLSVVEVRNATPPDISTSAFFWINKKAKLIVPAGTKAIYEADPLWNRFALIEESAIPADVPPVPTEKLTTPCIINVKRTAHYFGAATKVTIILNGKEVGKLGNNKSMVIQTDYSKNVLIIKQGRQVFAVRRFDATDGGEINVEFSMWL